MSQQTLQAPADAASWLSATVDGCVSALAARVTVNGKLSRERLDALQAEAFELARTLAEREAARDLMAGLARAGRATLGADKNYDTRDCVAELRKLGVTPHVAQHANGRRSAIDGRTTRHPGYAASQRIRKRIEEVFGWGKEVAGLRRMRLRGLAKVDWAFTLRAAAYNLIRLPKLLGAAA
jgi:IS5 family transposase